MFIQDYWSFDLDQSTKLGLIVFKNNVAFRIFLNEGMTSGNRDISNSEIIIMPSSYLDLVLLIEINNMKGLCLLVIVRLVLN